MKKILFLILAFVICITPVFATEGEAATEGEIETVSTITSVAGVTGIGVLLVGVITFIFTKLGWFQKTLSSIIGAFSTIFGKDGKAENIPQAIESVKTAFSEAKADFEKILADERARFENLRTEYEAQHKENNEFKQAFALLCIYANNINPYVKNEIYRLIKGEIPFKETIEETAKEIENIANAVKDAEPKIETPYLDTIAKE